MDQAGSDFPEQNKSTQPPQAPLPEALNLDAWTEAEMTRQMISPLISERSPVREYKKNAHQFKDYSENPNDLQLLQEIRASYRDPGAPSSKPGKKLFKKPRAGLLISAALAAMTIPILWITAINVLPWNGAGFTEEKSEISNSPPILIRFKPKILKPEFGPTKIERPGKYDYGPALTVSERSSIRHSLIEIALHERKGEDYDGELNYLDKFGNRAVPYLVELTTPNRSKSRKPLFDEPADEKKDLSRQSALMLHRIGLSAGAWLCSEVVSGRYEKADLIFPTLSMKSVVLLNNLLESKDKATRTEGVMLFFQTMSAHNVPSDSVGLPPTALIPEVSVNPLVKILTEDSSAKERAVAAATLRFSRSHRAMQALEYAALNDSSEFVQEAATRSLMSICARLSTAELADSTPYTVIGYVLQNSRPEIAYAALDMCDVNQPNHSLFIPLIRPLIGSSNELLRAAAIDYVRFAAECQNNTAAEALPELSKALDDSSSKDRAAQAVGRLSDKAQWLAPKIFILAMNPLTSSIDVRNAYNRIMKRFMFVHTAPQVPYITAIKRPFESLPPLEERLDATPDLERYYASVIKKVIQFWHPPVGEENRVIAVNFRLADAGEPVDLRVSHSGGEAADAAALKAIKDASPFCEPPIELMELNVRFDYDYFRSGNAGKARPHVKVSQTPPMKSPYMSGVQLGLERMWKWQNLDNSQKIVVYFHIDANGNVTIKRTETSPSVDLMTAEFAKGVVRASTPFGPRGSDLTDHQDWKAVFEYTRSPETGANSVIKLEEYRPGE